MKQEQGANIQARRKKMHSNMARNCSVIYSKKKCASILRYSKYKYSKAPVIQLQQTKVGHALAVGRDRRMSVCIRIVFNAFNDYLLNLTHDRFNSMGCMHIKRLHSYNCMQLTVHI